MVRDYLITQQSAISFLSPHLEGINKSHFQSLCTALYDKVLCLFSSQRKLRSSTLYKLRGVIEDILRYIYRKAVADVVALPKEVFVRAQAHGGSMRTLLNYKTIRSAFEKLGIIQSLEIKTYKGGPCQHYSDSLESEMKILREDEFVGRHAPRSSVCEYDKYSIDILGDDVRVDGGQVTSFVIAYETKLKEYHQNPFIKILKDGKLFKGSKLSFYIRGAAICAKYNYDVRRFIEAQFFFFHQWKDEAADIRYVTSVYSMWNSIGRYENYCYRFKDSLNYLGKDKDNIEETIRTKRRKELPAFSIKDAINISQQDYFRIKDTFKLSDRKLFLAYGHPLKPTLSLHFLMDNFTWLVLLKEKAWGEEVDVKFWSFLGQVDIQILR